MIAPRGLVGLLPPAFESGYISGAVKPYLLDSQSVEERPALLLIDLALSKLDLEQPKKLPVSPRTVIDDNIGFRRGK
ncbi:hypothetical protein [Streptomyces sp. BE133]|uniref:hypothetical protein n=1 Tax=Streptomyces sp. BE133 TaxID=3002523 RepID=UPI002E7688A1|nr:hypothetical protein [Streptomyces sp. BE133]MEE1805701.1 hypothetical protein [Streptomyces sp. BE133]